MPKKIRKKDALDYHAGEKPGKLEVVPTKPTNTQRDLALAYSPGVAEPCKEIHQNKEDVYKYTAKGNLVGIITDGTAVLGLGNLGPEAAKPVMEGKSVLFKVFADIDGFDIELNTKDVEHFISVVKSMEPTFGGINLEDIKSPECFEIEARLKDELSIPVMHDDQHGTAMISSAGLLNALELVKKKIEKVRIVVSGAGASAVSCTRLFVSLGAKKKNIIMTDSKGVIRSDRSNLDSIKKEFATDIDVHTLEEAMKGSDVFIGLSMGNVVTPNMLKSMSKNPIVFAMANPDPEIDYNLALKTRKDIIMATGRSDFPNQVNNVLGFPFIFRGALDVRATRINEEMKLAAVKALAELAKKPVPDMVTLAYGQSNLSFGKDYIIPKPIDPRLISAVAPAVAKAAMDSGVAKKPITNWEAYEHELRKRLGLDNSLMRVIINRAKRNPKRVVFAEADNLKILQAAQIVADEGIAIPILLGNVNKINSMLEEFNLELPGVEIIDPMLEDDKCEELGNLFYEIRKRKGYTRSEAIKAMNSRNYFGTMMVETGQADALISGLTRKYPTTIRPALQIVGVQEDCKKVAGMYIMITKKGPIFFSDATVNVDPGSEDLVDITELTAKAVKQLNIEPRIAMLSYSNFGSSDSESPIKVAKAVEMLKKRNPEMIIDGELQANFALNKEMLTEYFPFNELGGEAANTLIFPNLSAGNVSYKLLQALGTAEAIGPVLLGLKKSIHVLQLGSSVREIVNMVAIAVMDAQNKS